VHARNLAKAMDAESRLLNDYAARLQELQRIVGQHRWEAVEKNIASLQGLAGEVEAAEGARVEAFRLLKADQFLPSEERFDRVLEALSEPERGELQELGRRLKTAVVRVKGSSGLLGYYVRSALQARRQVLEELYPHRKGRLYSRSGRAKSTADESLMLDRKY
jgi:flagellar biosynthesis/type III secretory pathway chaperone